MNILKQGIKQLQPKMHFFMVLGLLLSVVSVQSFAAKAVAIIPSPPQLAAKGYLLIDADTGRVLVEHNAKERLPPASLTKIMTSYVVSSVIKGGTLSMDEEVNISVKAWRMEGSRMFIKEGTQVKVEDLLRGIIVQSGNDASVAMAEHIAGSEEAFVDVMNQQAQRLGMSDSNFMNVTGLPSEDHYTTATDLSKLTRALIRNYPDHYKFYSEKQFVYNNIRQPNRNKLLWRDKSVDGVKTGHTNAAGYCLVASAERKGTRLISVVMGTGSEEARATESQKLITYGFRYYETLKLYEALSSLKTVRVWGGESNSLNLGVSDIVQITIPRGSKENLDASLDISGVVEAPIQQGQVLGKLNIKNGDKLVAEIDLVALDAVEEAGFFGRLWDAVALFFKKVFAGDTLAV